jgi:hypothetical protein
MKTVTCEEARERMMLGEDEDLATHLESCESCRREAGALRGLIDGLAATREIEPPAALDAVVRAAISGPVAWSPLRHPYAAVALAVGALVVLVSGLTAWLVETPLAERAIAVVVPAALGYLALSSAATLPILLWRRRTTRVLEVNA